MTSMKIFMVQLALLLSVAFCFTCSSHDDCTEADTFCYYVGNVGGASSDCAYGDPTQLPYQMCLSSGNVVDIESDSNCEGTEVVKTSCVDDTQCEELGECCLAQTCIDGYGLTSTNFVCAHASNQGLSTADVDSCVWGSCQLANYEPADFPCDTGQDCLDNYSFENNCCAEMTCDPDVYVNSYCVPSATAGQEQTGQFGGINAGCTTRCLSAEEVVCTAVNPDGGEEPTESQSECASYDSGDTTYCCGVAGDKKGTYISGTEGLCMTVADLEGGVDNGDGTFTVCAATALQASALISLIWL